MMDVTALVQVKAFARQEGVFLALIWLASFLFMVYVPASSWGFLMAVSTPFFVGWRLGQFRSYALNGVISFRRGLAFSWYTFFYAILLFAVFQYVYFRYFDHGALLAMLHNNIATIEASYKAQGMAADENVAYLKEGTELIGMMSPIHLSFIFMMQNLIIGTLLSLPIAFFCKKARA